MSGAFEKSDLSLTREEMRKIGYDVIDRIIDHYANIRDKKVLNIKRFEDYEDVLDDQLPLEGEDPSKLIADLDEQAFRNILHVDHPRFYSFIPGPGNFMSVMAETMAAGYNVFAGHWMSGSSAAAIETITINWLNQLCGFPATSGGIFVSGGSMANMMAVITARANKLKEGDHGVVYFSDQTHASVIKGLRMLGIPKAYQRPVGVDEQFQIDINDLSKAIAKDIKAGLKPLCVIGNAGTTNTGAVDPLNEMADLAEKFDMWFHIDGAFGAAAIITDAGKRKLQGLERADSLTLDPHKWWFQTFEIGCLLVRENEHLPRTFNTTAEYLWDTKMTFGKEKNYYDYGMQLTRSFRALKLYLSLKTFGLKVFERAVAYGIDMATYTEKTLRRNPNWEIVSPASLGVINFRYRHPGHSEEELNRLAKSISQRTIKDGYSMILTTVLKGKTVLRMCPIHPELTKKEIDESIARLEVFAQEVLDTNQSQTL